MEKHLSSEWMSKKKKKAGVAMLISDLKLDFKPKYTWDVEEHCIIMKGGSWTRSNNCKYASNMGAPAYIKQ